MSVLKQARTTTNWYDLCDDGSISGTLWDQTTGGGTSTSKEDNHMISLFTRNGGFGDNASKTLTTKIDLKTYGQVFRFQAYGMAYGAGGSSTAYLTITDGSDSHTLATANVSGSGANTPSATFGIMVVLTVSDDGDTVNFKRTAWTKSIASGGTASVTIESDDADLDITGWSALKVRLGVSQAYADSSSGRGQAGIDKIEYETTN